MPVGETPDPTRRVLPPGLADLDLARLFQALEAAIMVSSRTLTRVEVAEQAGVPLARASALWAALGFPATGDDQQVAYGDADVMALRLVTWLTDSGFVDPQAEVSLVRSMGRSFARLAEWEVHELSSAALSGSVTTDQQDLEDLVVSLVPVVEDIHTYVWRRHLAHAAGRLLLRPSGADGVPTAVGFADIVGFTRRSRDLTVAELAALVETFEAVSVAVVTAHGGRVIKTIGDEVLFATDTPAAAGRIALDLAEAGGRPAPPTAGAPLGPDGQPVPFPEVRVGVAYGEVVSRLGDVFGPVVNVASRLTSVARPGRVLVDQGFAEALGAADDAEGLRVRKSRTVHVKGYSRLDTWHLGRTAVASRPLPAPPSSGPEPGPEPGDWQVARAQARAIVNRSTQSGSSNRSP